MSMDLFFPDVGQVYHNRNGCDYECTAVYPAGRAAMRRIKDGWTLVAVGVRQCRDGAIEWDYSLGGCWTKSSKGKRGHEEIF